MRWQEVPEYHGFGKCQLTTPRPWLEIWRMPYKGSLPMRMICLVCGITYRNQGVSTGGRFLRTHRRCGFN